MNEAYRQQARLLLAALPEVARENCLAMHGGTAINLFIRDMPRLSVDIDLTYVIFLHEQYTRLIALPGLGEGKIPCTNEFGISLNNHIKIV